MGANGTVGVKESSTPDHLVDNGVYTVAGQTVYRQRVEDPLVVGTPAYAAGSGATTVNVPAGGRLLGFSCYANGADITVSVQGGVAITVRNGASFSWPGRGNYVAPAIVFTGPADYFVEWVV